MRRALVGLIVGAAIACTGPAESPAPSKGAISGKVKDAAGAPIAGASIKAAPGSATTTSGTDGSFTFTDLTLGAYSLTATMTGFADFTLSGVGVVANGTTNVSLVMQPATSGTGTITSA